MEVPEIIPALFHVKTICSAIYLSDISMIISCWICSLCLAMPFSKLWTVLSSHFQPCQFPVCYCHIPVYKNLNKYSFSTITGIYSVDLSHTIVVSACCPYYRCFHCHICQYTSCYIHSGPLTPLSLWGRSSNLEYISSVSESCCWSISRCTWHF